jgi:hypothetical protein
MASTTPTAPAALQRTPDGAAELGCADATDSSGVTRLAKATRAPLDTASVRDPPMKPARCARGPRDRPRPASSRPRPGRRCGGSAVALHITGCCHEAPQSFAGALLVRGRFAPCGFTATPVMSCAPSRLPRGQLGTARHARRHKHVRPWLRHRRKGSQHGALRAQSWTWPPPTHHPPPKGAPWLPPLSCPA